METIKCPVCGNPGISDYKKEDVTCHHCGSDLRIFRTISDLSAENDISNHSRNRYKIILVALPILVAISAVGAIYFPMHKATIDIRAKLEDSENYAIQLSDSIQVLQTQIREQNVISSPEQEYYHYFVVNGDCAWKIVKKVYGRRSDWKDLAMQIAKDNNIWNESTNSWEIIHPGQILKIKKIK